MDSAVSVSKGVFLFDHDSKKNKNTKRKDKGLSLFDRLYQKESWYTAYKKSWNSIENNIKEHNYKTYNALLNDIVNYVKQNYNNEYMMEGIIPSATLLTGVSQPDHASQFATLIQMIRNEVTPHVALISSQDAPTIKHLVECAVGQLVNEETMDLSALNDSNVISFKNNKLRRNQCTMKFLKSWYQSQYLNYSPKKKSIRTPRNLVIILPDFESFNSSVLQDFVLIISSYMPSLPIVLVFGVATSVSALHKSFPYHVSSKLLIKVFNSHSSPSYMNEVLENIFLTHRNPFQLSGKSLELLTDVFLFYDFSVTGLVKNIKFCMMDHYYGDNVKSLCCEPDALEDAIKGLTSEDLENIRRLLSFRRYVEKKDFKTIISLFEDDKFFKDAVYSEMRGLHDYVYSYYVCVRLLFAFVKDLPKNLLGKTIREIHTKSAVECITDNPAFKECMQLLNFQSQLNLVETIREGLKIINSYLKMKSPVKPLQSTPKKNKLNSICLEQDLGESFVRNIRIHLMIFMKQLEVASTEATVCIDITTDVNNVENIPINRYKLKEKLLKAAQVDRVQSEFEMIRARFVHYLEEMFEKGLQPPHTRPFYEILFFTDKSNVKKHIVGSPRGALHTALSNPNHYLQCSCCHLPSPESMTSSLLDLCLVYKLHRECGKYINIYDWLQAFAVSLRAGEDDEQQHQDTSIQTRFFRAVAELQFLGFIKTSQRKTDHVMRLTW